MYRSYRRKTSSDYAAPVIVYGVAVAFAALAFSFIAFALPYSI